MKIYSLEHNIFYNETNALGKLSLESVFSFMQEAALRHASEQEFGQEYCAQENCFWVLSRINVQMNGIPAHRDTVNIQTWTNGISGPFALRDYIITDAQGNDCVRATSCWMLLDRSTFRPIRLKTLMEKFPRTEGKTALPGPARKIGFPYSGETGNSGAGETANKPVLTEKTISPRYSEIDEYRHVNNTRYVRWCVDMIPENWLHKHNIRNYSINYLHSAEMGHTVTLQCLGPKTAPPEAAGPWHFRGILDTGEVSFTAALNTESNE